MSVTLIGKALEAKRTAATLDPGFISKPEPSWHEFRSNGLPLIYGVIQAAITTGVATAIATLQLTDFKLRFVEEWLFAWGLAFLTMLPVVIFVSPLIQRCVLALTFSPSGEA